MELPRPETKLSNASKQDSNMRLRKPTEPALENANSYWISLYPNRRLVYQILHAMKSKVRFMRWPHNCQACFCLRVDIDTIRDAEAIQAVLNLLKDCDVKATFFVATGRDDSGRNMPKALSRADRGKYLRRYGLGLLRGLLLPSASVEDAFLSWREILEMGHEIGLHGYWHRNWIRNAQRWSMEDAEGNIGKGLGLFVRSFGFKPVGFAAPGFVASQNVLMALQKNGFVYTSNSKLENGEPLQPRVDGKKLSFVEMPVTCPTLEELIFQGFSEEKALEFIKKNLDHTIKTGGYFCYYVHPSFEAYVAPDYLERLFSDQLSNGDIWTPTLREAAEWWKRGTP